MFSRSNVFHAPPLLEDDDVKSIVETTAYRVVRLLERRGVLDPGEYDELADEEPALAGMTTAFRSRTVEVNCERQMDALVDPALEKGRLFVVRQAKPGEGGSRS